MYISIYIHICIYLYINALKNNTEALDLTPENNSRMDFFIIIYYKLVTKQLKFQFLISITIIATANSPITHV